MAFQRRVRVGGIEEERKRGGVVRRETDVRTQDEIADSTGKSSMITEDKRFPLI
jgi:hypothetical protein